MLMSDAQNEKEERLGTWPIRYEHCALPRGTLLLGAPFRRCLLFRRRIQPIVAPTEVPRAFLSRLSCSVRTRFNDYECVGYCVRNIFSRIRLWEIAFAQFLHQLAEGFLDYYRR